MKYEILNSMEISAESCMGLVCGHVIGIVGRQPDDALSLVHLNSTKGSHLYRTSPSCCWIVVLMSIPVMNMTVTH